MSHMLEYRPHFSFLPKLSMIASVTTQSHVLGVTQLKN
jgi:hypothetical protein